MWCLCVYVSCPMAGLCVPEKCELDPTLLNPFNPSFPRPFHPNARRVRTWSQRRRQWRLPPRQRCADSRLMGHESHSNSDAHTLARPPSSPPNAPHVPTHTRTGCTSGFAVHDQDQGRRAGSACCCIAGETEGCHTCAYVCVGWRVVGSSVCCLL